MGRKGFFRKHGNKNPTGKVEGPCWSKLLKEAHDKLDPEIVKAMAKTLEELSTSGSPSLDVKLMKQFKQLCRKSDDYVEYAFLLIMKQLGRKHSEIRLSAFQVADELFHRSHAFRQSLITHLQEFLSLTTETEAGQLLPPPKPAANRLKTDSLKAVQQWQEKFGKAYRKLSVGYDYLKNCKKIDFDNIQAQNLAERKRIEEEERKKQKMMADRLAKVLVVIAENREEIDDCLKEADSCLKLIMPTPLEFDFPSASPPHENEKYCSQSPSIPSSSSNQDLGNDSNIDHFNNKNILENDMCDIDESTSKYLLESCSSHLNSSSVDREEDDDRETDSRVNQKHKGECDSQTKEISNCDSRSDNCSGEKCPSESKDGEASSPAKILKDPEKLASVCEIEGSVNKESGDAEEEETDISDDEYVEDELDLQVHGFRRPDFSLTIEVPSENLSLKETEDNTAIVQSLKDASKLISGSYLPQVTKWLEILGKNGGKEQDIKTMIDLKVELESVSKKCLDLNLFVKDKRKADEDSDSDDLEDVPEKEGYEAEIPKHLKQDYGTSSGPSFSSSKRKLSTDTPTSSEFPRFEKKMSTSAFWNLREAEKLGSINDPTSLATAMTRIKQEKQEVPSTSKSSQESAPGTSSSPSSSQGEKPSQAPFIHFGHDLAHWENPDEIEAPLIVKYDSLHRFWAPSENETEKASEHEKAALQYRVFNFTGQFEPVKWKCRALMPNGKLCERMDRVKCPFHGKIIARDKDGKPNGAVTDSSDSKVAVDNKISSEPIAFDQEEKLQPWKDPDLQREIEAATGHNLGSSRSQKLLDKARNKGKGKGKGKGKKSSGLTNIKEVTNTSRRRLENKVFSKRSMKKVCATLDAADYKRVRDKFGNQFNYSFK